MNLITTLVVVSDKKSYHFYIDVTAHFTSPLQIRLVWFYYVVVFCPLVKKNYLRTTADLDHL